ncbi:hypothetical protein [Aquimarina sp. 433]
MRLILPILLFLLISCKEVSKKTQPENLLDKKYSTTTQEANKSSLINNVELDKKNTDSIFNNLFNKELIGVSIKTEDEKDIYKKYWIDFNSRCMCDSPSIFLDKKNKKVYIYNYCRNSVPPKNKEPFFEYVLEKIVFKENELEISIKNNIEEEIILKFNEIEDEIYAMSIDGDFPSDYIGDRINNLFTPSPSSFEKEDCGDFDG